MGKASKEGTVIERTYNCVFPPSLKELEYVIDHMREITKETFLKHVPLQRVNDVLMWQIKYGSHKAFMSDYIIRTYKVSTKKVKAYVLVNSGVEYVFQIKQ